MGASSTICASPSPIAATTSASTAGQARWARSIPSWRIDEYLRLIRLFVGLGITKVRLTGGEPLLRRGLLELVEELAQLRTL